jgi:hypothetical protein
MSMPVTLVAFLIQRMQRYVNGASVFAEFAREPDGEFTARLVCK